MAETTLEALEVSLRTAELVLGHTLKGVRRTYDHHSYMEEKKEGEVSELHSRDCFQLVRSRSERGAPKPTTAWGSPLTTNVQRDTSMDVRSLIVLVAALLLFLAIVVFIVAYLFQPIPVQ